MSTLARTVAIAAAMAAFLTPAQAQVEVSSSLFYGSPYVWRGEVLSSGFVMQPYVEASLNGFSIGVFGNLDPRAGSDGSTFSLNEADVTAAYAAQISGVDVGVGYTLYTFPGYVNNELELSPTQEFFGSVGLANLPLSPSLFVAYDFDAFKGVYAELGVGHTVYSGGQEIGIALALGFDGSYVLPEGESGLSHLALTAGTDFEAGPLTISPLVGFHVCMDETYRAAFGQTVFYGGIGIGF